MWGSLSCRETSTYPMAPGADNTVHHCATLYVACRTRAMFDKPNHDTLSCQRLLLARWCLRFWCPNRQNVPREGAGAPNSLISVRKKKLLSSCQVLYYLEVQMPRPVSLTLTWPSLSFTAGGHSSNLGLRHAVNLPERDADSLVRHGLSARQDVQSNTVAICQVPDVTRPCCSPEAVRTPTCQ